MFLLLTVHASLTFKKSSRLVVSTPSQVESKCTICTPAGDGESELQGVRVTIPWCWITPLYT